MHIHNIKNLMAVVFYCILCSDFLIRYIIKYVSVLTCPKKENVIFSLSDVIVLESVIIAFRPLQVSLNITFIFCVIQKWYPSKNSSLAVIVRKYPSLLNILSQNSFILITVEVPSIVRNIP